MFASQLLSMAAYLGRLDPRRSSYESERRTRSAAMQRLTAVVRWLRPYPPPPCLNDHLRRDIGLGPLPKERIQIWPW